MSHPQPIGSLLPTSTSSAAARLPDKSPRTSPLQPHDSLPAATAEAAEAFLLRYRPDLQDTAAASPVRCYNAHLHGIAHLQGCAAAIGRENLTNWIVLQLDYTARQWSGKDQLTTATLTAAARAIIATHAERLNPYELMLYLQRLRSGHYGRIAYGQLTPDDILAHLPRFYDERGRELRRHYDHLAAQAREQEHREARLRAVPYETYLREREAFAETYNGLPADFDTALVNHLKAKQAH